MSPTQATPVAALRRLAALPAEAGPDEELLHRFCANRDEAAFAAIVRRHGGLVLDVCRTVLRNEADAEDAFQATFVTLAAAARRVRRPAALAGWLHAVAWRTAGKARRARDRRRAHEARVPPRPDVPPPDPSWAEVRQTVHEEVNRLPDRYRVSIVLFYLAGRSQDEVGRALGLSTAGAKKRLERGRDLLRSALDGRGFGPTAVLAAAAVTLPAASAALTSSAVAMASRFLTDRTAVPATILSLLSTGARPMSAKLMFGAVAFLGVATTAGLGGFGGAGDQAGRPDDPPTKTKTADGPRPKTAPAPGIDQFLGLEPGERLKLVEKLAAGRDPFTAATKGDLAASIVERGSVEPANAFDVTAKVKAKDRTAAATTIKWVIDEGSLVKKGDRLVLLDDTAIRDRLGAATVIAKAAEADAVGTAQDVELVKADNDTTVRLAEIDVRLAQFERVEQAKLALKVEQAKLKLEQAKIRGKARLVKAEAGLRAKMAAAELESKRKADIEAELKQCEVLAPADGLVVYPAAPAGRGGGAVAPTEPGAEVREGQTLVRVVDLKQFLLATRIPEAVIKSIRVGQAVEVRIDAFPNWRLKGKVARVSPIAAVADWQRADVKAYPVTVAIEDAPEGLKPHMTGEVRIVTGERKGAVQVPITAIVRAGPDRMCFVKSGQELVERKVIPGVASATAVEIREGLKEGDVVLTDPAGLLK
jgi:HlyD family secretion protein